LLLDALGLGKLSVGAPYFEAVFVPLMVVLLLMTGIGPLTRWRQTDLRALRRPAVGVGASAAAGALAIAAVSGGAGGIRPLPVLGLFVALWIVGMVGVDLLRWQRSAGLRQLPRATLGMMVAHLGVAAFAFGVTMVRSYEVEQDQRFATGQALDVAGYSFRFLGVRDVVGPNYEGLEATVEVHRGDTLVAVMRPQKRVYRVQRNPMTEAAIQPGLTRDLYVSLGEEVAPDVWTLRLYVKPFVDWIWGGCGLMALGGALAISDRRYRGARAAAGQGAAVAEGMA
jgi:cytochrome c-type biogenesis protein CcmF